MVDALGWAAFVGALIGTLVLMADRGVKDGLRMAWFLATLAVPAWFSVNFRSIGLDAVTGVAGATLIALLTRPFTGIRTTWMVSDLLLVVMVLSWIVADLKNQLLIPGTVLEQVRTWIFPYLLGRVFLTSWDDMGRTLPTVMILATVLSVFGIVEAFTRMNVLAMATGKSWELLEKSEGFRWGLKRAQGITNHPIYFGLLLALTLPWVLMGYRAARERLAPRWWSAVPYLVAAATFVTVSRSAQLAILFVLAADQFFRRPRVRPYMILIAIVGAVIFGIFREQILDLLGAYAGEEKSNDMYVVLNGVEYEYTGTRHRDLLLIAYEQAIDHAGWFGFGTTDEHMKPFIDPEMPIQFVSIDHQYLLQYLRYGVIGTATFIAFALSGVWNLAREAWARDGPLSDLAAGLFGASIAVIIMIRGVALSPDFGFTWMFVAGLAASMRGRRYVAPVTAPPSAS